MLRTAGYVFLGYLCVFALFFLGAVVRTRRLLKRATKTQQRAIRFHRRES